MKTAAHQYEDKLLEFAYGELARQEADAVEAHVRGCARCSEALTEIRGVRSTMAQLPMVAAPEAGLDSLLAYAEQAAKRAVAEKKPSFWKRFGIPLTTVMALATVGVIAVRANSEFDTSPASAIAQMKVDKIESERAKKDLAPEEQRQEAAPVELAAKQDPNDAPTAGEVRPTAPIAHPAPGAPVLDVPKTEAAAGDDRLRNIDANKGGKANAGPTPQSLTRREIVEKKKSKSDEKTKDLDAQLGDVNTVVQDFSNARGGYVGGKDGKREEPTKLVQPNAAPPPPPAEPSKNSAMNDKLAEKPVDTWRQPAPQQAPQADDKPAFGLSGPATSTATPSAPRDAVGGLVKESKEESRKAAEQDDSYRPAPKASAPAPVVAAAPEGGSAPKSKAAKKPSMTLQQQYGTGSSSTGRSSLGTAREDEADESLALQGTDAKSLNDESKFLERERAANRTQSLESARVAGNSGDRGGEIQLSLKTLQLGATGYEKAEALKRLCDAYDALGESEQADQYCRALLKEFPNTVAAKVVTERRGGAKSERAKKPAPAPARKSYDFESDQKKAPADAAQSY